MLIQCIYTHTTQVAKLDSTNWQNKTVFTGDNLPIMRGMNSESVDLIYLDPPFNSNANYAAPIGSIAAGAEFKDTWTLNDLDVAWLDLIESKHPTLNRVIQAAMNDSDKSYLVYMAVRLLEMKRILKDTGSIYLHCDPTMSHYLKLVMDAIFGRGGGKGGLRNEIVWCYSRPSAPNQKQLSRVHNIILWYSVSSQWTFNPDSIRQPYATSSRAREGYSANASKVADGVVELDSRGKFPESWIYIPVLKGNSRESTGYPTQKPIALLERIIKASSKENDIVFDPFCGCATTMVAADRLLRQWVGIDLSSKAIELVNERIKQDQGGIGQQRGVFEQIIARNDIPQRTDIEVLTLYNSIDNKKHLYGQQAGNCNGCQTHFEVQHLEVDHIIAKSKGGTDHIENLQLLCGHCNKVKGNRGQEYLFAKLEGRQVKYS